MAPADHEYAPREGELAGLGEVLPVEMGPKHFLSGALKHRWLDGCYCQGSLVGCQAIVSAPRP
jgi:hypothetical protein